MRHERGFTLIELMIVVVIIGILAAVAVPKFQEVARSSKAAEADPLLKQIRTLQERYRAREGTYAEALDLLEGGATLSASGKYYGFSLIAEHESGYCVVATPNAQGSAAGLTEKSMDAAGHIYASGDCS